VRNVAANVTGYGLVSLCAKPLHMSGDVQLLSTAFLQDQYITFFSWKQYHRVMRYHHHWLDIVVM